MREIDALFQTFEDELRAIADEHGGDVQTTGQQTAEIISLQGRTAEPSNELAAAEAEEDRGLAELVQFEIDDEDDHTVH